MTQRVTGRLLATDRAPLDLALNAWSADATPPTLWHFSSTLGVEAIVRSECFWARHLKHLHEHDRHEFRLGWGVVRAAAGALANSTRQTYLRKVAFGIADDKGPIEGGRKLDAFVACFTDAGHRRHVRTYFDRLGKTAHLEIDTRKFVRGLRRLVIRDGLEVRFMQVRYDLNLMVEATEVVLEKAVASARRGVRGGRIRPDQVPEVAFHLARSTLLGMALSFKRSKYEVESEWRFVVLQPGRARAPPPYIELQVLEADGSRAPLPLDEGTRFTFGW